MPHVSAGIHPRLANHWRMSTVTQAHVVASLRQLGLGPGDLVMVHSSLSSFGQVEGGAETVIQALLETLGPEGTLVMPTLCQTEKERRFETWDIRTSPSDVGKITEVFRTWPGAARSDHATHSVAALGPLAERITAGHATAGGRPGPWGPAAFAAGSPWQAFYDLDARILFAGVTFRVNTMGHFIEHLVAERALHRAPAGQRRHLASRLRGWCAPGAWPAFDRVRLQAEMDRLGLLRWATCGDATLLLAPARLMVDHALAMLEADPEAWFDGEFLEWQRSVG